MIISWYNEQCQIMMNNIWYHNIQRLFNVYTWRIIWTAINYINAVGYMMKYQYQIILYIIIIIIPVLNSHTILSCWNYMIKKVLLMKFNQQLNDTSFKILIKGSIENNKIIYRLITYQIVHKIMSRIKQIVN